MAPTPTPLPATSIPSTTTTTTSIPTLLQLYPSMNVMNSIGGTSNYNYSATVPVTQTAPSQTLDHNYSALSATQTVDVSAQNQTIPNPSSISSSVTQPFNSLSSYIPWNTIGMTTPYTTNAFASTSNCVNTNYPTMQYVNDCRNTSCKSSQQPVDLATSSIPAKTPSQPIFSSQPNYSHYTATINAVVENAMINSQQQFPSNSFSMGNPYASVSSSIPSSGSSQLPINLNGIQSKLNKLRELETQKAALVSILKTTETKKKRKANPTARRSKKTNQNHSYLPTPSFLPTTFSMSTPSQIATSSFIPNPSDMSVLPDLPMTSCLPVPPSTCPPLPPNWNDHLEDTVMALVPYKLFPIRSDSLEYATLAALLNPLQIIEAEQVVNPTLWSRFINTRKDMLRSKSDDLQLLLKLGLDEADVMRSYHHTLNFNRDNALAAYPYNDNIALLFHCTRSAANVDNILLQGLDERVGNTHGLLGRGIYFADDPYKSMQYDGCGIMFICAVLLGDCLSVDHLSNKSSLVREPEKVNVQKRNFNDLSFDSIVAKPGAGVTVHTEYVVYNRYQCCPLYKIKYNKSYGGGNYYNSNDIYSQYKNHLPSFSWVPNSRASMTAMPNPLAKTSWPFYARAIFSQMGVEEQTVEEEIVQAIDTPTKSSIEEKLAIISNMGFNDRDNNLETLKKFDYNLDRSVNYLLDQDIVHENQPLEPKLLEPKLEPLDVITMIDLTDSPDEHVSYTSSINGDSAPEDYLLENIYDWAVSLQSDASPSESQTEDCLICCNEYETTSTNWSVLECSHKLCVGCYTKIETTRTTMAGITHTFIKCPFCQGTSGIEIGTCPNGTMTEVVISTPCEGYEQWKTISIRYGIFDSGYQTSRTVYIPDNDEGKEVLKLLRIAWDRRLCFTIGTSVTTGCENQVVWNIHHKTSQRGGVQKYGFPDPTYFERVKLELKAYGIES